MLDILRLRGMEARPSGVLGDEVLRRGQRGRHEDEEALDGEERARPQSVARHSARGEVFGDVEGGHRAEEEGYEGDQGGEPGVRHCWEAGG